ncbi:hypothetical protein QOT17_004727 [Balamuthia mandrillaris]
MRQQALVFAACLLYVFCTSSVTPVTAQTCEEWDRTPTICADLVDIGENDLVYVPPGFSLAQMAQTTNLVITGLPIYEAKVDPVCESVLYSLLCNGFYKPCVVHEGEHVALPRNLCRRFCQEYVDKCSEFTAKTDFPLGAFLHFPPGFIAPLTCNETDAWAQDTPWFPLNHTILTMPDGVEKEVECVMGERYGLAKECNPPLKRDSPGSPCMFECPLPAYTEDEWDSVETMQLTVGFLSLIGTFILILTYGLSPKHRVYPANLILMIAISSHIAAIAIVLPIFAGGDHETIWCGPETQLISPDASFTVNFTGSLINDTLAGAGYVFSMNELVFKSHTCNLQGTILQFAFLSTTTWWCILTVNMAICLFATKIYRTKKKIFQVVYHCVGWGFPTLLSIIPVAASKISLQPGGTFCFVSPEDSNIWMIFMWYVPVGLLMLIAVIVYVSCVIKIIIMFARFHGGERTTLIVTYLRLLLFIFTFLVVYTFIFAYAVNVGTSQSTIEEEWATYLNCFVVMNGKNCELDDEASNYSLAMLRGFGFASLGFLLFLNFIVSKELSLFWWNLVRSMREEGLSGVITYLEIGEEGRRAAQRKSKRVSSKMNSKNSSRFSRASRSTTASSTSTAMDDYDDEAKG